MKIGFYFLLLFSFSDISAQTIDSVLIKQVDSLIQVSRQFIGINDFNHALEINAVAEKLALDKLGRESESYGRCAFNRGRAYFFKSDYPEAEKWYLEAKGIQEKVLGREHPDFASSLTGVANCFLSMGYYEKAEPLFHEAKVIRQKTLGEDHPLYISSLNQIAVLYWRMGKYAKTEPLWLEILTIREKMLGKEHPDYATSLNSLANLYVVLGNYEKAEPLYLEAKGIREKALGIDHIDYASSLSSLGILNYKMGNYEKALPFSLKAKAIREKLLGTGHSEYAASLNNLAILYQDMGNYEEAERLYREAIAIRKKVDGAEHPEYAASLNNLATLYNDMGNYGEAERLYIEAVAIRKKVQGIQHVDYATNLSNLATLYYYMGTFDKAEKIHLEALDIRGKVLGKEHPEYANSLIDLAVLYYSLGNYEKSEQLYLEAIVIQEKTLGKDHPDYAGSLNSLALIYSSWGNYEKAVSLTLEAVALRKKTLGTEHAHFLRSLNNLASIYQKMGIYEEAEPLFCECSLLNQSLLKKAVHHLSERELGLYMSQFSNRQEQVLSFINASDRNNLVSTSFDNSLFYKGFLLSATSRLTTAKMTSPESIEKGLQLKAYRRRLAAEYAKPIAERRSVAELEERANIIEKELARLVAGYADAIRQVKWQEVQKELKADEAAVEFVNFRIDFPETSDSVMYAALVVIAEISQPIFIPLFEEKELIEKLSGNKELQSNDLVAQIYTRGLVPHEIMNNHAGLYDLLWKPLDSLLTGIKKIYYSPAGMLNQINLDAIPVGFDDREEVLTLADKYSLVRLGSTRSIVIPDATQINPSNEIVLYGGIRYEMDTTLYLLMDSIHYEPGNASSAFTYALRSVSDRGGDWSYLLGTEREIAEIERIGERVHFPVSVYQGRVATEETVKEIGNGKASPRILHFATHGFFFPDPELAPSFKRRLGEVEPVFKSSDNPMIRSGLILAGGNYAWHNGRAHRPDMDDGILTAYEISQMNLSNTELVVLSACETGLGDIQGNEGVYGLQRAFKIAGAKYLIMSLWQVPDKETMEFMTAFYKNWLESNMTIPDAFRKTQREMRDRFFNPYSWAGFVLVE